VLLLLLLLLLLSSGRVRSAVCSSALVPFGSGDGKTPGCIPSAGARLAARQK